MPSQQQNLHSLNNIVNTTSYYSYTSHLQSKFSFLHLSLTSFPIIKGREKGNKTARGAKTLHITSKHSSYNSLYFSASLHFSPSWIKIHRSDPINKAGKALWSQSAGTGDKMLTFQTDTQSRWQPLTKCGIEEQGSLCNTLQAHERYC